LGGSSNLNFLIYIRGHPADFNRWAEHTGDKRWAYENVLPFFMKSEDFKGEFETSKDLLINLYLRFGVSQVFMQKVLSRWIPCQRGLLANSRTQV